MSRLSLFVEPFLELHLDATGPEFYSCFVLHSYITFVYICNLLCCYLRIWKNWYIRSMKRVKVENSVWLYVHPLGMAMSLLSRCGCLPTGKAWLYAQEYRVSMDKLEKSKSPIISLCGFASFEGLECKGLGVRIGDLLLSYCDDGPRGCLGGLPQPGETGRTFPYLNANEAARGIMNYTRFTPHWNPILEWKPISSQIFTSS